MAEKSPGIHGKEEGFDYAATIAKITANYDELTKLPINSILIALRIKGVILPWQKEEIEAILLQSKRMEYLLDMIIMPSLKVAVAIKFKCLLEVMEQNDDVIFKYMAYKLGGSARVPEGITQSYPGQSPSAEPTPPKGGKSIKENKQKQDILRSMLKARKDKCLIKVRYGKVLFCGAGAAGKTNFLKLLMEENFETKHVSTEIARPQQVTAMKAHVSSKKVAFKKMDIDEEIHQLMSYLPKNYTEQDAVPDHMDPQPTVQEDVSQNPYTAAEDIISEKLASDHSKLTNLASEDEWNILTFMDTGGQPQFISLLPTVNSFAMITFIIHKMTGGSKSLDDKVMVQHGNQHGENSFSPHPYEYTYIQLIKTLMTYTSSILMPDVKFLQEFKEVCKNKNSNSISFVGTHSANVSESDIEEIDKTLQEMIQFADCKNIRQKLNKTYDYLVPVDNKKQTDKTGTATPNSSIKKYTDPAIIRQYIYNCQMKQDTYSVPIQWLLLELEIRKVCNDNQYCFITYDDVLKLATQKNLGDEDFIKDGLRFHHFFGVLLYFEKVEGMCNLVITNHQWLFNKLTEIVLYTLNFDGETSGEGNELRKGIFTDTMLDQLNIEKDFKNSKINTGLINPNKSFFNLLMHLRIIAPLNEDATQYFMPSLLKNLDLAKIQDKIPGKNSFKTKLNEYISAEPFLIQFESLTTGNLLPRGLFCFLIVELICSMKWEIYKKNPHDNLITFVKVNGAHYVTLIDNILFLEVHVTHPNGDGHPIHYEILTVIQKALFEVKNKLDISTKLKYGFLCKMCQDTKERHLTYLRLSYKEINNKVQITWASNQHADCPDQQPTTLNTSHRVWKKPDEDENERNMAAKLSPKDAVTKFGVRLLQELPLENQIVLDLMDSAGLLPLDYKATIISKTNRTEKVGFFKEKVLGSEPAANIHLPKLLDVMDKSGDLTAQNLAKDIREATELTNPGQSPSVEPTPPKGGKSIKANHKGDSAEPSAKRSKTEILKDKPKLNILSRTKKFFADKWKDMIYELFDDDNCDDIIKIDDCTAKSNEDKCMDMLRKWVRTDENASYGKLIDALNAQRLSIAVEKVKEQIFGDKEDH